MTLDPTSGGKRQDTRYKTDRRCRSRPEINKKSLEPTAAIHWNNSTRCMDNRRPTFVENHDPRPLKWSMGCLW